MDNPRPIPQHPQPAQRLPRSVIEEAERLLPVYQQQNPLIRTRQDLLVHWITLGKKADGHASG